MVGVLSFYFDLSSNPAEAYSFSVKNEYRPKGLAHFKQNITPKFHYGNQREIYFESLQNIIVSKVIGCGVGLVVTVHTLYPYDSSLVPTSVVFSYRYCSKYTSDVA